MKSPTVGRLLSLLILAVPIGAAQRTRNVADAAGIGACPTSAALRFFKHQIAYQRTEEYDPLRGLSVIHADVWMRGPLTGFYVHEQLNGAIATIRDTYIFDENGLRGGGTCPVEKNWRECIEGFAGSEHANDPVSTCVSTIDIRAIAAWRPSPNNHHKQQIATELRLEIENHWEGAEKIVVRDFSLNDNQLTIYIRTKDGEYYQGCDFDSMRSPHCESWHLFGQAPPASIRRWIFELPYELK